MTYYMIYTDGDSPCTDEGRIKTLKQAVAERDSLMQEDRSLEIGGLISYEIWKVTERDGVRIEEQV